MKSAKRKTRNQNNGRSVLFSRVPRPIFSGTGQGVVVFCVRNVSDKLFIGDAEVIGDTIFNTNSAVSGSHLLSDTCISDHKY